MNQKLVVDLEKIFQIWLDRDMAYPANVLHLATECNNKNHSAAFPEGLPEWFIKLFTKEGDTVLDPFMGSDYLGVFLHYAQGRAIRYKSSLRSGLSATIPHAMKNTA